jgi:hypothetical protein
MDEAELDVKDMLTSFETEAKKYAQLSLKMHNLNEQFQEKTRIYEGLKKARKDGTRQASPIIKFVNSNAGRWEDCHIHEDYLEAFYDLAIRQAIHELRIIKKEIDYLLEVQK